MAVAAAVPGAMLPGFILPGQAMTGAVPPSGWVFGGPETLVYPTYIDTAAGHTLVASPGGTYSLAPPPGTGQAAVPGDGFWTAAS